MHDLLIKNAAVFDGVRLRDELCHVFVTDGLIEGIRKSGGRHNARQVINASGAMLSHGFIDLHTHIYPLAGLGIHPESAMFPFGVTGAADAGSAGCDTLRPAIPGIAGSRADVKIFVNVSAAGLATLRGYPEYIDPATFDESKLIRIRRDYPDLVIGLKVRMGRETVRNLGLAPLEAAAKLARKPGLRLMVHAANSDISMDEICGFLAEGDILSHAFHKRGCCIIGEDGRVTPGVKAAYERGVIFDTATTSCFTSFEVLAAAEREGIRPHTISSDLTDMGVFKPAAFCLPMIMSKMLAAGMTLEEVLRASTAAPGEITGIGGTLDEGSRADIVLFRVEERDYAVSDGDVTIPAKYLIRPQMTIKDGVTVWRDMTF